MRNKFERRVALLLGEQYTYEDCKLSYTITHTYTPDFIDHANKHIVESKGFLRATDRAKMLAVKKQNPEWTFEFIFQDPRKTISKRSRTTYATWAEKNGFTWRTI